jgi:tetratricopeptide (TPR) repeat protein
MRFVKGLSLFDILRDGPLENRRAASYMHQVALALQAAHDQGILHRDLKPHNIMVEEQTDRPLVTDFGLAKFVEGQNSITYAGQVMGTPAYMSPEQAQDAASVTPAADQYSIGATLYHLLTGRPPFQAANIAETIRQIIDKQPLALRQLNAGVHRDLETICLKSIHKDPSRRYESCHELAEDLQRYLQGRPIVARPVGRLERTWRWCQRNPIPASLTATAALLLIAFMASIVIGYRNTSAALAVSESRLQKALQVVDELFTRVSEDELLNEPGMQPLRAELLEKALKHYEYFLSEGGSNSKLGEEVAAAHFRVGMIYQLTRRLEDAERELLLARQQQEKLMDEIPSSDAPIKALADTCNALGSVYSKLNRNDDAIAMLEEAASLRTRLVERQPEDTEYRRLLSNATMNMGMVRVDQKQVDPSQTNQSQIEQGLSEMQLAQSMRIDLLKSEPDSVRLQRDLALGWYSIGKNQAELGRLEDSVSALKQGVAIFRELAQKDSRSLSGKYRLVVALTLLGGVLAEQDKSMDATSVYEEALIPVQSLAQSNPEVPDYQHAWLDLLLRLGIEYSDQGNLDRSVEVRLQALELAKQLSEESPDDPILLSDVAYCLGALGDTERRRERYDEAREYYTQANHILNRMLEQDPDSEDLKKQQLQNEQELRSIEDR